MSRYERQAAAAFAGELFVSQDGGIEDHANLLLEGRNSALFCRAFVLLEDFGMRNGGDSCAATIAAMPISRENTRPVSSAKARLGERELGFGQRSLGYSDRESLAGPKIATARRMNCLLPP